jgi:hypothetical protein|tara:strand:- start:6033 stop:6203 length:171 start_codon:yes stop_codon:yes gene_type:complete
VVNESSVKSSTIGSAEEVATRVMQNKNSLITHVNIFSIFFVRWCFLGENSLQKFSN